MSTEIVLPKLGLSMNQGTIAAWLVQDGASVDQGAPLFTMESDTSAQEIGSPASGTLRILKPAAESYAVGTVLGEIDGAVAIDVPLEPGDPNGQPV